MQFYEHRMRPIKDIHISYLKKMYEEDGDCTGLSCSSCPFGNSIINYGSCGNTGGVIDFEGETMTNKKLKFRMKICKKLIDKYSATNFQSKLQQSENEITSLKIKIKELENEIATLKTSQIDMVLEKIKNHKFTKVTKQSYILFYDSSYPSWMVKECGKEFVIGLTEFTNDDAIFLCELLNRNKIEKEQIKNINKILRYIKID